LILPVLVLPTAARVNRVGVSDMSDLLMPACSRLPRSRRLVG
jgi:hypothetical protein